MGIFDLVTVGHFSIDFISSSKKATPKPMLGGTPTYVSLAARALGVKVSVISNVGKDFPLEYLYMLETQGVDLSRVKMIKSALTTSYFLKYEANGRRNLILRNKAPPILDGDIPSLFEAKIVHIAPIANEISLEAVLKLRERTNLISLDPQGFIRYFEQDGYTHIGKIKEPEILMQTDVFKASIKEIKAVTGKSNLKQAISWIGQQGVKIVIITKGAEGALIHFEEKTYNVPAIKLKNIVDTTGAGDVFIGGFLAEYVRRKDILWCACVGSAASSFVVEKLGPNGFGSEKDIYEKATKVYDGVRTLF